MNRLNAYSRRLAAKASALSLALAAPVAFAQSTGGAIDVTGIVAKIEAQLGPIGLIGMAVLGVVVALVAFVWVRRSIRG